MLAVRHFYTLARRSIHQTPGTRFALRDLFSMSNVSALVDGKIKSKKVMVFSKTYCPFCTKAKKVFQELLKENKLSSEDYEVMEIENDPNCDAIQAYLQKITGAKSVSLSLKCCGVGGSTWVTFGLSFMAFITQCSHCHCQCHCVPASSIIMSWSNGLKLVKMNTTTVPVVANLCFFPNFRWGGGVGGGCKPNMTLYTLNWHSDCDLLRTVLHLSVN